MSYEIFIINLDSQKRRWAFMRRQFELLDLQVSRLPAFDGRDPAQRATADAASFAPLPNGEVGCFESHRRAWQEVVQRNLPGAFVLEDDVVVAADFAELDLPNDLLEKTDLIKLDVSDKTAAYGPVVHKAAPGRELRALWGTETSTGCYFVSRRGAEKLLRHSGRYFLPVDMQMFDLESRTFYHLDTLRILPAVAAQMRFIMPKDELDPEMADGLQERRRLNFDPRPEMTPGRRMRLYLRRLLDWDFTLVRKRRRKAFLADKRNALSASVVFSTDDRAHIDDALSLLQDTTSRS